MSITLSNNDISSSDVLTVNDRPFSEVAFSGDYYDLTNTPTFEQGTLTDSWVNGSNWFRKYSDGFIEQGGRLGSDGSVVVTFHTSFTTTNYTFIITPICRVEGEDGSWAAREVANNRSVSSTRCWIDSWGGDGTGRHGSWYVCGY